jgi:aryl-alcohol dehydrogenase
LFARVFKNGEEPTMQIKAAVVSEKSGPFAIETVELCEPRPDEVIVRVVASGMCQTDLHGRDGYFDSPYPAVYGHEGAGIVHAVGNAVRALAPGDHVVMSYPWCGGCANCQQQRQNYCVHGRALKSGGTRADGSTLLVKNGAPVYSAFFQQSSFGTFALSQERYTVKVRSDAPLELLGPLACSGQTGAGAVLNVIKPAAGESIAVFGVGAVGLSGLMAANIAGCDPIIAVDVHDWRLALARELGATHTINHDACADVVAEIRKISGGGVRYALETSAVPAVFREAIEALMPAALACCSAAPARAAKFRSKCRSCSKAAPSAASFRATACRRNSSQSSST